MAMGHAMLNVQAIQIVLGIIIVMNQIMVEHVQAFLLTAQAMRNVVKDLHAAILSGSKLKRN